MSNRILTYKGLMADGAQETILLSTRKGEVGYKIVKFVLFPSAPGVTSQESVCKVYKVEPTTVTGTVDFADNTLIAAAYQRSPASVGTASGYTEAIFTVFDNEIFNQDIFITHDENAGSAAVNYYIELEVIKLSEDQAMVATLKDIRNNS